MAETFSATAQDVALVAATAKTAILISAPSTATARLTVMDVSFDGVNPSATPVKVEVCRFAAGSQAGTAYTLQRGNGEAQNRAALCTCLINLTTEPGTATPLRTWRVSPVSGWPDKHPLGRELYIPTSTLLGIRFTAPAAVNVTVNLEIEE